jgi:hypothetical protein
MNKTTKRARFYTYINICFELNNIIIIKFKITPSFQKLNEIANRETINDDNDFNKKIAEKSKRIMH